MADAMFDALLAVDPNTLASAAGSAGKVYAANDTLRATPLTVTDLNGIPYPGDTITAGVNGFIPPFLVQAASPPVSVVWVSGPWVFPLKSIDGVYNQAEAARQLAQSAIDRVTALEANGVPGGGTSTVTSTSIQDATALGRSVLTAATAALARQAMGAGTSDLRLWDGTATGAPTQAQVALSAVRTSGAQTIDGKKTFVQAPGVPVDSFSTATIIGLKPALDDIVSRIVALEQGGGGTAPDPDNPNPTVNLAPTASFTHAVNGLTLTVDGSTSTDPEGAELTYTWSWGDGSTSTGITATKTYATGAPRPVTLTVREPESASALSHSVTKTITTAAPTSALKVVLVTDPAPSTSQQALLSAISASLGFTPQTIGDSSISDATIADNDMVVIASGVNTTTVLTNAPALKTTTKPVVAFAVSSLLLGDNGLSMVSGTTGLTQSATQTTVAVAPSAAGQSWVGGRAAGAYPFYTVATPIHGVAPNLLGAGVVRSIDRGTSGTYASGFLYPAGAQMGSGDVAADGVTVVPRVAPGPRAWSFWASPATGGDWTQDARELAGALVAYVSTFATATGGTGGGGGGGGTRLANLHPWAETSPWNLPIATTVELEATTGPKTVALRQNDPDNVANGGMYVNQNDYSHPVTQAETTDPFREIRDTVASSRSGSGYIPNAIKIAGGTDRHGHVIQPDRRYIDEHFNVTLPTGWPDVNYINVRRHHKVDLTGKGIGPMNGTRAYGGSAVGGLIRIHEVQAAVEFRDGLRPSARGIIPHATAWAFRPDQLGFNTARWIERGSPSGYETSGVTNELDQPGWIPGRSKVDFSKKNGYQYPATECDSFANNTTNTANQGYFGVLLMGSFFMLDPAVDIEAQGWSWAQKVLAYALQDYGGYCTDWATTMTVSVEHSSPSAFRNALIGSDFLAGPLRALRSHFRYVTNNTEATPGGGALGATRRRPLAGPLA